MDNNRGMVSNKNLIFIYDLNCISEDTLQQNSPIYDDFSKINNDITEKRTKTNYLIEYYILDIINLEFNVKLVNENQICLFNLKKNFINNDHLFQLFQSKFKLFSISKNNSATTDMSQIYGNKLDYENYFININNFFFYTFNSFQINNLNIILISGDFMLEIG